MPGAAVDMLTPRRIAARPAAPRRSGRQRFLQLREACIRARDVTFRLLVSMRAAPIAATCDRVTPRVVPATRGDLWAVSPAGDNSRARQQAVAQHRAPVWKAEAEGTRELGRGQNR